VRSERCIVSFPADFTGDDHMTAFIRCICLASLLAAGSAWAQQQVDTPDNPHSTKAKEKESSNTPSSVTNQQVDQAEKVNPHHPDYNRERAGSNPTMDQHGQMAGMDHDAMMKNATPQKMLQKLHLANLQEIEMAKQAEQNGSDRIKSYAQTLLHDHQDADLKVKDLAKKKNLTLSDTAKNPDMQKQMDAAKTNLSSLKGPEFDRAFASRMSMEHQRVISMAQAWRQNCSDQEVCNLIDTLLPQLQQHAQMADRLKGPAAQGRTPENR
jgi:predicted outer membrane protein